VAAGIDVPHVAYNYGFCRDDFQLLANVFAHFVQGAATIGTDTVFLRQFMFNDLDRQILRQLIGGQTGFLAVICLDFGNLRLRCGQSSDLLRFVEQVKLIHVGLFAGCAKLFMLCKTELLHKPLNLILQFSNSGGLLFQFGNSAVFFFN
jgi:hypothetical protein